MQALETIWAKTLVLDQAQTILNQWNTSPEQRSRGEHRHHCQTMTPSFSFWKALDCLSWNTSKKHLFCQFSRLSFMSPLETQEGHSLSCLPCYHHLLHILSHFQAATSHLHCVQTKSHRELPTCASRQCHSPGMHWWASLPELYLPWHGKASTTLLATLVSRTEDLTVLASQRNSSWSFSPAPFVSFKDLLCTFII